MQCPYNTFILSNAISVMSLTVKSCLKFHVRFLFALFPHKPVSLQCIMFFIISNLQKYSHVRLAHQANQKPFYRSKLWWCGLMLMGMGEMGNFAAYGFASIMLVAPLGSIAVIGETFLHICFMQLLKKQNI